ncbi:TaqI-like C-terminal specificity domain-containing protein [Butyrivibrio sp. MB2005]|uniref:TaqI-like C-terminal specificity domain-containing protein n=1 Tax=Butyrivibrio sp. MB2005 TaxID=1280678 RepID=UPI0004161068|nr:TaqI-like C-terminal specificity domain-containing protein [Butyrivibrio sp. MB2005]
MLTLTQVCRELSISPATGRNWIKLGKIKAEGKRGKAYMFSEDYVRCLKEELANGSRSSLKSRRNKVFISGKALYRDYASSKSVNLPKVENIIEKLSGKDEFSKSAELVMRILLTDCALKLTLDRLGAASEKTEDAGQIIKRYLSGELDIGLYAGLIDALINDRGAMLSYLSEHDDLPFEDFVFEHGEDILGLLYISVKSIGLRKKEGAYYTPNAVVKRLLGHLFEAALLMDGLDKKILDPCCGSGNFLLQLPPGLPVENLYGCDIDRISVLLARINLALKYKKADERFWAEHITEADFLESETDGERFDIILGNPPWGYSFTDDRKEVLRENFESGKTTNPESCDLFLEHAVKRLSPEGLLSFVLPESVLTVKAHAPIRAFLLKNTRLSQMEYLGEVFDRVQCPSIILQIRKTEEAKEPLDELFFLKDRPKIYEGENCFVIKGNRMITDICFDFLVPDEEYALLEKLDNLPRAERLKDNAIFALGIVTGANKEMLQTRKTAKNEIILKGQDVFKYNFRIPKCYINYDPDKCQQVARTEYYRAEEKLLYRFIGNRLVFAYDDNQTLSLNSCNVLIPKIPELDIKYILAVLNSRIAEYYFRKKFRSVKVLRSHIEQIPIPGVSTRIQEEIAGLVDRIMQADSEEKVVFYDELDARLAEIYDLTEAEYDIIKSDLSDENVFLL